MNMKTVAIVGLGGRGHHTYAKYQHIFPERMKIVAIADIDPEKVQLVKEEFNVSDLEKKKSELEKESKKLIRNYEKLVEYKLSGLVEEIDFILKKDVFDNKMKYIEEQINQVVFEIAQVEEKEKHFYKELDELENVNKKINKLDFIRALATRCDITKTEDGYELNIKFKFQL